MGGRKDEGEGHSPAAMMMVGSDGERRERERQRRGRHRQNRRLPHWPLPLCLLCSRHRERMRRGRVGKRDDLAKRKAPRSFCYFIC